MHIKNEKYALKVVIFYVWEILGVFINKRLQNIAFCYNASLKKEGNQNACVPKLKHVQEAQNSKEK